MGYIENFKYNEDATYNDLALELLDLPENGVDEIITQLLMHSGLGRLEYYDMLIQNVIKNYDNLKEWRDEAGEIS